jgi:hypothetical protein
VGFHQLLMAGFQIFVLWKRRDLIAIALAFQTVETTLGVVNFFFWRTLPVLVPGAPGNAIFLVLQVAALAVSWHLDSKAPALAGARA